MTDTETVETPKPRNFWEKYSFPVMAIGGIVIAGVVSFWLSGHHGPVPPAPGFTRAALQQKPKGPVLVLNAGQIMGKAIRYSQSLHLNPATAMGMGHDVGDVIEQAANKYAQEGYVVISRGIMSAPPQDNITPEVEQIVMAKLNAEYGGNHGSVSAHTQS